mmetsp:Transcript_10767/g.18371  ORF Transcript_10767/g.18371 Transcript_10767/m.18371 type:complete len:747 (+) Transcript_10767:158-2398(+)
MHNSYKTQNASSIITQKTVMRGVLLLFFTALMMFVILWQPSFIDNDPTKSHYFMTPNPDYVQSNAQTCFTAPADGLPRLAVTTIFRDINDEEEATMESLRDGASVTRPMLMRLQLLHAHALAQQVDEMNAAAGLKLAEVVVVTSGGLLVQEMRHLIRMGIRIEIVDGGNEMKAIRSLSRYDRVLYLRPGTRIREGITLCDIWNIMKNESCMWRESWNVKRWSKLDGPFMDHVNGLLQPATNHARGRRLGIPSRLVTVKNPAVDINKLVNLSTPLVDWANDPRMAPVLGMFISPHKTSSERDAFAQPEVARFHPKSLDECTTFIMSGTLQNNKHCKLSSVAEVVPVKEVLRGGIAQAQYALPIEFAWRKDAELEKTGAQSLSTYRALEESDAKACAKAFQVDQMSKLARKQIKDHRPRPPRTHQRKGRFAGQVIVMKTHLFNARVNKTLHAWAKDIYEEGGEVIAAVQNTLEKKVYKSFLDEYARNTSVGYELIQLDSRGIVDNLIPFDSPNGFAKSCLRHFDPLLCKRITNVTDPVFNPDNRNVDRLMWFHTFASTAVIMQHLMHTRPDIENAWILDYDVVFTGPISRLIDGVSHDDADLIAPAWTFGSSPAAIVAREAKNTDVNMWKSVAQYWEPKRRLGRILAGGIRLSKRMMHWSLESAFVPMNWSIDEIFYFETCERHKPACKFSPLQLHGLVSPIGASFSNREYSMYKSELSKKPSTPTYYLQHPIKTPDIFPELEPWLDV